MNLAHIRRVASAYAQACVTNAELSATQPQEEAIAALMGAVDVLAACGFTAEQVKSFICAALEDATDPVGESVH